MSLLLDARPTFDQISPSQCPLTITRDLSITRQRSSPRQPPIDIGIIKRVHTHTHTHTHSILRIVDQIGQTAPKNGISTRTTRPVTGRTSTTIAMVATDDNHDAPTTTESIASRWRWVIIINNTIGQRVSHLQSDGRRRNHRTRRWSRTTISLTSTHPRSMLGFLPSWNQSGGELVGLAIERSTVDRCRRG